MSTGVSREPFPHARRIASGWANGWNRLGSQTAFYVRTIGLTWDALLNYKREIVRLIAQMSMGVGALAVIGGTVVVMSLLTTATGSLTAIQGFRSLSDIGVEALTGFFAAYIETRFVIPVIVSFGLAVTVGAGATAQLGAMRINEEIDALEVMAVRSVAYLVSTRVIAGVFVAIPLTCLATIVGFFVTRYMVVYVFHLSSGVYDHYFNTFLQPVDLVWTFVSITVMTGVIMLVHTYYGFTASGGPAGVGEAVGRAVRASLVLSIFVVFVVALSVYGESGNFHLSG